MSGLQETHGRLGLIDHEHEKLKCAPSVLNNPSSMSRRSSLKTNNSTAIVHVDIYVHV